MRRLSLLLLACLTLGIAWAERVSVNTAQQVAANVAAGLSPSNLRSSSDLKLVYAAPAKQQSGLRSVDNESDYYIFNVGTGDGFIIVAGEDRVRPVLGYSAEGEVDMEKIPENMKAWLAGYQEEISWVAEQNISASDAIQKEWQEWLSGSKSMGTPVVSLKTAQWDQGDPYNRMTPTIGDQHTLTGCVATAMAIIMEYHKFPDKPIVASSEVSYTVNGEPRTETIPYADTHYDWNVMSNVDYNSGNVSFADADAVAELMWHCGANAHMNYGLSEQGGSSAQFVDAAQALRNIFGYSATRRVAKSYYTWSEWTNLVKNELNNHRPVYYDGQDQNNLGGHAFICDGYTSDDYFHINWGWGYRNPASYNDYYLLTCLDAEGTNYDFSRDCGMMLDVYPTDRQPEVELRFNNLTCDFPLQVGVDFTITCGMRNIGGASFIGSVGIGVVANDGTIKNVLSEVIVGTEENPLLEDYGWTNGFPFGCYISEPLADGEMLVPIYKTTDGDWQVMEGDVKGIGMDGIIEKEEEEEPLPTVTVQRLSNPFSFRYMAVDDAYYGYSDWEFDPVQYKLTGAEGDVWVCYTLKNSTWVDKIDLCCDIESPIYSYSESEELKFDSEGNAWVQVPADKITDGLVTNYLYWEINEKVAEDLDYSISLFNADKSICYQTFDYMMSVVEQPMDLVFSPENLSGGIGDEFLFSIIAKNVDPKMAGQETSISLSIEGSVVGEVEVDLITESGRKSLNIIPCDIDVNACRTEAEIVENLAEGKEYQFALRFKDGRQPGGVIRVEEMFISGNMRAVYTKNELPIDYVSTIIVDAEMPYENAHNGKDVIVKATGIYTVNTEGASINSLTVEDGGQVIIQQPLTVNEKARVILDIPTDKWRTVAIPFDALVLADGTDMCFKQGYRFVDEQRWIDEEYQTNGQYALTTSPYIAAAEFDMTHVVFEQMGDYVYTLPIPECTAVFGNKENGNWFHFVANPNWQNLMVNGKAYVLNDAGNSFELQQSPVIPPFQAYMIASEAVMKQVSSLRIGDIPTSNEDLAVTGFRVWTESGHVCFETTEAKNVAIYSMNGVQQCRFERSVGVHRQQLPQGIYIVVCDGTAYKVSVK